MTKAALLAAVGLGAIALAGSGDHAKEDRTMGGFEGHLRASEVRPERRIEQSVEVAAARERVYEAWTTEEGVKSFFAPGCRVEMTPGGAYEIWFLPDAPPGSRGAEGTRVLSFLPNEMLSFEWNFPPSIPSLRGAGAKNWVVVRFEDAGAGRTKVSLTHLGWKDDPQWDKGFEYFSKAWPRVLGSLKERLESGG